MSDDRLTKVLAYVDGEMDAAERAAFEVEMAADPALAAEVHDHRALAAAARPGLPPRGARAGPAVADAGRPGRQRSARLRARPGGPGPQWPPPWPWA
jgi:anti-sigma factor RsiW